MTKGFEFTFGPQEKNRDHRTVLSNGKFIGYQPKGKTNICVQRCGRDECRRENCAMSVASGICCWCGWEANKEFELSGDE